MLNSAPLRELVCFLLLLCFRFARATACGALFFVFLACFFNLLPGGRSSSTGYGLWVSSMGETLWLALEVGFDVGRDGRLCSGLLFD